MSPDQFARLHTALLDLRDSQDEMLNGNGHPGFRQVVADLYGDDRRGVKGIKQQVDEISKNVVAIKHVGMTALVMLMLFLMNDQFGLFDFISRFLLP